MFKAFWEGWKKFGEKIGHVVSSILLTIIYIIVVTPFAICFKLFNKQFFRFNNEYPTYWKERKNIEANVENYRRQW